ncbi:hypothetical protein [Mariniluteicoccus endophyticus]
MTPTTRTAALAAAGALWLAGGVAYAPDAAAAPPTVTGSEEAEGAPELPDGDAVDTMPGSKGSRDDTTRNYHVKRTDTDQTVLLGFAMSVPNMGTDGIGGVTKAGKNLCSASFGGSAIKPGRAVINNGGNAFEGCGTDKDLSVELRRYNLDHLTSAKDEAPLLMRVVRVPKVVNLAELPSELPKQGRRQLGLGTVGSVTPSESIAEPAPVKSDHTYKLTITTNKPQYFVVDVDWGQTLMVQTDVAAATQFADAQDAELQANVIGPALNDVERGSHSLGRSALQTRTLITDPVVWRSYTKGGRGSWLAGKHIIAVGVPEAPFGKPTTLTYALTIDVEGEVKGKPEYANGQAPTTTTQKVEPASTPAKRYAAAGLGVAGALMLISSGVVWLRSR